MASSRTTLGDYLRADREANPRDPKAQFVLVWFRVCQWLQRRASGKLSRFAAVAMTAAYRGVTEFVLGIELRPKTKVGKGLSIYHGFGLVVNDHSVIGDQVRLRNGVTIGHQFRGGGAPVIGDRVEVGAGAILLGAIEIGDDAVVGAGAVVTKSVPARAVVAGNPARVLRYLD